MYFIRTRGTETTTHTIHNYHGTYYYQPCPGIIWDGISGPGMSGSGMKLQWRDSNSQPLTIV